MRKLFLIALLAVPFLASSVDARPAKKRVAKKRVVKTKVFWRASFASALTEAKRTGKPIFVDFYATWCGPCKYLDAVTYQDRRFVAESKKWVMVKVDAEKNAANVQLATKYKIEGFPSMLFLRPNGKESGRAVGGYPPEMLVPKMKKAGQKASGGKSI